MQVDSLSWDISSCILEVKSADWYKKKFEEFKNHKQTDDEDPEKMNDEQKLREEFAESFRTANHSFYTTDNNFKKV